MTETDATQSLPVTQPLSDDDIRHAFAMQVYLDCYQRLTGGKIIEGVCHPTCSTGIDHEQRLVPPCQTGQKLKGTINRLKKTIPNFEARIDAIVEEYSART